MKTVYLGLGSNIPKRERNIQKAIDKLQEVAGLDVIDVSTMINTKAVSTMTQPEYLNGVIAIKTILTPKELLELTQQIEIDMGRDSKGTGDPRTIDIDILFYGEDIICEEGLDIPHPLLHEREFVLIPLNEIAPGLIHPVLQESISSICTRVIGY
jgi:2-amino-4-hydroxy-6-hydroxymethyldihydropteridine diphosphokinase